VVCCHVCGRPCLTYGMRGIIQIEVRVQGPKRNLHSGVDGGAVVEPLNDLLGVLATLVDSRGMVRERERGGGDRVLGV
jgi:acetylornithine deacetylase/succinyl-diaminopimelate desuccinylase-like protein